MAYAVVTAAIALGLLVYLVLCTGRRGKDLPPGAYDARTNDVFQH